jgi:endothelin-converting enzyme
MQEYSAAAIFGHLVWETISPWLNHVYHPKLDDYVGWLYNEKDRDDRCIDFVSEMLPYILDRYYISATYTDQAHKTVDRMAGRIRKQFVKAVKESTWMSDEAKQRAATKLERIQQNIAYQKSDPDVRSAEALQKYYTGLNITTDSHLYNYLQAKYLQTVRTYEKVGKAPHRGVLKQTILANAFYDPTLNSIQINAGYSQLPAFHPDVPAYVQYAGLGSVIGHEFGHSIDSNGRWHDENAEVRAWWDNATVANYEKRAQCFVDQYSEYTMPGLTVNVNGERTLGENLADAGGLRAAYEAWVEERKEMPDVWDQNLPGLEDFTHEQLFFLFWGIKNCDTYSPAIIERFYVPDEHAPNLVRLLAGADNSKAFKEAWGCKVKEPKCTLF